jgi:hypothetical protein
MTKDQLESKAKELKATIGWEPNTPMYAACCRDIDRFYGIGSDVADSDCPKVVFDRLVKELAEITSLKP